ncbi:MAG: outer membrane protein transport protein [Spirochaetota bacterium]|jgi:long-chain fatty acid transport protein|nr:outer membrane protein transport protein [Spirochaetota bacterium]
MKRIFASFALLCISFTVMAAALDNTHIGAKANIMGRAFTGLADDASAVFYNPAGLAFQNEGLSLQAYGMYTRTSLWYYGPKDPPPADASPPLEADTISRSTEKVINPEVFAKYRSGKTAFGLGVYTPYGSNKYHYNYVHAVPRNIVEQTLRLTAISASFAYRLADNFSLGLSVSGYYGKYFYNGFNLFGNPGRQSHDFSGFAGAGGNLGALFQASEALSLGLTLKAPVKIHMDGGMSLTEAGVQTQYTGNTEFTLPLYITLGTALRTSDTLTFTLDFNYAFYSKLTDMRFGLTESISASWSAPTGYTDAVYIAVGVDGKATAGLSIRGGIQFAPTPTTDEGLTYSCDLSRLTEGFGIAYKFAPQFELTASFQFFQFFGTRRAVIRQPDAIFPQPYTEKYFHTGMIIMGGFNLSL